MQNLISQTDQSQDYLLNQKQWCSSTLLDIEANELDENNCSTLTTNTTHNTKSSNQTQDSSTLITSDSNMSYVEEQTIAQSSCLPQPYATRTETSSKSFLNEQVTQYNCPQAAESTFDSAHNHHQPTSYQLVSQQDNFNPTKTGSSAIMAQTSQQQTSDSNQQQMGAPKLTAMNLFAFRDDTLSSVLTECFSNQQQASWPTAFARRDERAGSMNSQNTFEDDQLLPEQQISSFMERINNNNGNHATVSLLDSSGSSLTEHIFANALSNLENSSCSDDDDVRFKDEDEYHPHGAENTSRISQNISVNGCNNSFLGQGFNLKEILKEHSMSSSNNNSLSQAANFAYQTPSKNVQQQSSYANQYAMVSEASCPSNNDFTDANIQNQASSPAVANQGEFLMMINNQQVAASACYQTPIQLSCQSQSHQPVSNKVVKEFIVDDGLNQEEREVLLQIEFLSFDQIGCRMLQRKLEDAKNSSPVFVDSFIDKMLNMLPNVMIDQFGNYLCQKTIEVANLVQLTEIVKVVLPNIVQISMSVHGTRAVQTLVEVIGEQLPATQDLLVQLIAQFKNDVKLLSMSAHGNHVIQAFLVFFRASETPSQSDVIQNQHHMQSFTQFIFDACMEHCVEIGSHKHGCCVMQRCLEKGRQTQKLALAKVIISKLNDLIEDPFGNYLVQNVLKLEKVNLNEEIFKSIATDFIRLSQMKFSSNVIEKCLESKQKETQIDKIFKGQYDQDDQTLQANLQDNQLKNLQIRIGFMVERLLLHQYGNYVLQKAIQVIADRSLRTIILENIKLLESSLCQTKHGSKVLNKLQKTYPNIFSNAQTTAHCFNNSDFHPNQQQQYQQNGTAAYSMMAGHQQNKFNSTINRVTTTQAESDDCRKTSSSAANKTNQNQKNAATQQRKVTNKQVSGKSGKVFPVSGNKDNSSCISHQSNQSKQQSQLQESSMMKKPTKQLVQTKQNSGKKLSSKKTKITLL